MSRPGRPRKSRPELRDQGTPQARLEAAFYGAQLANYPLGIMLANDVITKDEHDAGTRYAAAFRTVFGRQSVTATAYEPTIRGGERLDETPDEIDGYERCKKYLQWADERILEGGTIAFEQFKAVVVRDEVPKWQRPGIRTRQEIDDQQRLLTALKSIAQRRRKVGSGSV